MAPRDDNTPLPESLRALAAELDDLGDALVQSASSTAPKAPAIDGFTVVEPLGRGGMGSVWRARQESLGRDVALKTISETLGQNPDGVARFLTESRIIGRILLFSGCFFGCCFGLTGGFFLCIGFLRGFFSSEHPQDGIVLILHHVAFYNLVHEFCDSASPQ